MKYPELVSGSKRVPFLWRTRTAKNAPILRDAQAVVIDAAVWCYLFV